MTHAVPVSQTFPIPISTPAHAELDRLTAVQVELQLIRRGLGADTPLQDRLCRLETVVGEVARLIGGLRPEISPVVSFAWRADVDEWD